MKRILVIEDQEGVRATIREMLRRGGYEVTEATNGREGLNILEQQMPDVVVTDILMPEMEGLETIKRILQINGNIPIIAYTASVSSPYLEAALHIGAKYGLYKPFTQKELLDTVEKALTK